jgi:hypothetical protein
MVQYLYGLLQVSEWQWSWKVEVGIPSMDEGAAMATAARREKRVIVNFILMVLNKRLWSTGDKGVTLRTCNGRIFDYKECPWLRSQGKVGMQRGLLGICILRGGGKDIRQQQLSSMCRERHDYLLRTTIWALKRQAYVAALSA